MISRQLVTLSTLSLVLCSGCTLQDLLSGGLGGGKGGKGGKADANSATIDADVNSVSPPPVEPIVTEGPETPPNEDGLSEYDLSRLSDRFPHVATIRSERITLQRESARLDHLTHLNFMTELYTFATDVRRLPNDADRTLFANRMAEQGAHAFALYKIHYAFARDARRLPTDEQRDGFAQARLQIPYDLQALLLVHSYTLARDLRSLSDDAARMSFAVWIEEKPKSLKYFALYEEAYVYARDVRRLPTDPERHAFAVSEAEAQVDVP